MKTIIGLMMVAVGFYLLYIFNPESKKFLLSYFSCFERLSFSLAFLKNDNLWLKIHYWLMDIVRPIGSLILIILGFCLIGKKSH